MTVIRVPSPAEEIVRAQSRLRDQLRHSRQQWEARGRSLLLHFGYHVQGRWWRGRCWENLLAEHELAQWLRQELTLMRQILLGLEAEHQKRVGQLEQSAPDDLPKAVGALSWVQLGREICTWERFKNRRQVASYTGLCPGVHQTGGHCRSGSINRHGNPRVRHLLVEMIWRLERWQPDYPPVRALRESGARGAQRRKLAVASARRLAVDLWRLATGQTTAQKLGLVVPELEPMRT
jgi:transposase